MDFFRTSKFVVYSTTTIKESYITFINILHYLKKKKKIDVETHNLVLSFEFVSIMFGEDDQADIIPSGKDSLSGSEERNLRHA